MDVAITFWGVRGSYPTPVSGNLGVGGNTPCVEIQCGEDTLIIDAGTGIQKCGQRMMGLEPRRSNEATILFSHFHWDHVQGLPFFSPMYSPDHRLCFASALPANALESTLRGVMRYPHFPVDWQDTAGRKQFVEIAPDGLRWKDLSVQPFPLHHPQGAHGYRIRTQFGTIVYASDHEHGNTDHDASLRHAARDASVLIYDAQYTPDEYPLRRGWGHSTWLEGVQVARYAAVERLILFHHDPARSDSALDSVKDQARQMFPATELAIEGSTIRLCR